MPKNAESSAEAMHECFVPVPHGDGPHWKGKNCPKAKRRGGCTEEKDIPEEAEETKTYGMRINSG